MNIASFGSISDQKRPHQLLQLTGFPSDDWIDPKQQPGKQASWYGTIRRGFSTQPCLGSALQDTAVSELPVDGRVGRRDHPAIRQLSSGDPIRREPWRWVISTPDRRLHWLDTIGRPARDGRLAVSTLIFFNNFLACAPTSEAASLGRDADRCLQGTFLSRASSAEEFWRPRTRSASQSDLGTGRCQHCSTVGRYELSRRANRDARTSFRFAGLV